MVTLLVKEVRRFSKVWLQTVLSPIVTTSLYFLVFGLALGSQLKTINGVPYVQFVIPGLIMLAMVNAAFLNTSSSLFQSKINGTISDLLVAPVGALEIMIAYVTAAMIRAAIVGGLVYLVAGLFVGFRVHNPWLVFLFSILVTSTFANIGLLSAVFAKKFDHLSIIPNFVLTPLIFVGGVFYSVRQLPDLWQRISYFNPLLYVVNGLRAGLIGQTDLDIRVALGTVALVWTLFTALTFVVVQRGIALRS